MKKKKIGIKRINLIEEKNNNEILEVNNWLSEKEIEPEKFAVDNIKQNFKKVVGKVESDIKKIISGQGIVVLLSFLCVFVVVFVLSFLLSIAQLSEQELIEYGVSDVSIIEQNSDNING